VRTEQQQDIIENSFSSSLFFLCAKSSVVLSILSECRTSEDNDDALICSTPPTFAAVRLAE